MRYSRRDFLKTAAGGAFLLSGGSLLAEMAKTKKRPNILFAIADDWGWPHSPQYGDDALRTPTFDGIAEKGILFNHAYVSAPSCTPSRNAILTGKYHWQLGGGANLWSVFPEGHETYPNVLEENGYFVGSYRKAFGPGKDRPRPVAGRRYKSPEQFFDARPKDKPFCLWFGTSDPHRPYETGSGIKNGIDPEKIKLPPYLPDSETVRSDIADYYYEVQRFDREVGECLRLIEQRGELDNTIVVMTGDHGWPFPRGKSNLYDLGVRVPLAMQWPARVAGARVVDDFVSFTDFAPTFTQAAGLEPLGAMRGQSFMNVLLAGTSGRVDAGRDHVFTGKERHTPAQRDYMGGTPMRAIRTDDFLYIHNFKPARWPVGHPDGSIQGMVLADCDDGPTKKFIIDHREDPLIRKSYELCFGKRPEDELYDLKKDPHQVHNVAYEIAYQPVVSKLKARLFAFLEKTNDPRVVSREEPFDHYPYLGYMENPQ